MKITRKNGIIKSLYIENPDELDQYIYVDEDDNLCFKDTETNVIYKGLCPVSVDFGDFDTAPLEDDHSITVNYDQEKMKI